MVEVRVPRAHQSTAVFIKENPDVVTEAQLSEATNGSLSRGAYRVRYHLPPDPYAISNVLKKKLIEDGHAPVEMFGDVDLSELNFTLPK